VSCCMSSRQHRIRACFSPWRTGDAEQAPILNLSQFASRPPLECATEKTLRGQSFPAHRGSEGNCHVRGRKYVRETARIRVSVA
jgi:hypothetical protein